MCRPSNTRLRKKSDQRCKKAMPCRRRRGQLAFHQEGPGEGRWVHLRQGAEIRGEYMSSGETDGRDMAAINEGHAGGERGRRPHTQNLQTVE